MGNIAMEIEQRIQQLDKQLKTLLLSHLKEDATSASDLFTKQYENDRSPPDFARATQELKNNLTYELVLNTVFTYAPIAVCNEVTNILLAFSPSQFTSYLSAYYSQTGSMLNEWVIETILHCAPEHLRQKIVMRFVELEDAEICALLFKASNLDDNNFKDFMRLFNVADSKTAYLLIKSLHKINHNTLFDLFKTVSVIGNRGGIIKLFEQRPDEMLASILLQLLARYKGEKFRKLVHGDNWSIFTRGAPNLLHVIFSTQPLRIVEALFALVLKKTNEKELKNLLTQKITSGSNQTPLELAFGRREPEIASLLVRKLNQSSLLKPLITDCGPSQFYSLIHIAAQADNESVISYFLEQPSAEIGHRSATFKTINDLVSQEAQPKVHALMQAFPLHQYLMNSEPGQDLPAETLEKLTAYPPIVNCRWSDQNTLLHLAAARDQGSIVTALLQLGADLSCINSQGNNAIDVAVINQHLFSLDMFYQVNRPQQKLIIEALSHSLKKRNHQETPYSFLEETLQQSSKQPFTVKMQTYAQEHKDGYLFLLRETAFLLSKTHDHRLENLLKSVLKRNLTRLNHEEITPLARNAIQLQIISLLFLLEAQERYAILSALNLSEGQKRQLSIIIARALVQPAIFPQLELGEHQQSYAFLRQLSPSNEGSIMQDMARIHFQNTTLTTLPWQILQELAALSTTQSLFLSIKQRLNPILIVLALEKILQEPTVDQKTLESLLNQLNVELNLLNKKIELSPEAMLEWQLILNLTCSPLLKNHIKTTLAEFGEESALKRALKKLFSDYHKEHKLAEKGLLREFFVALANNLNELESIGKYRALSELIPILSVEENNALSDNLQNQLQTRNGHHALFSPGLLAQSPQLSQWFCNIERQRQAFSLVPLIEKVDALNEQVQEGITLLATQADSPLLASLHLITQELSTLSQELFSRSLCQSNVAWDITIETNLTNLTILFETLRSLRDTRLKDKNFKKNYQQLAVYLEKLSQFNSFDLLVDEIKTKTQIIDTCQAKLDVLPYPPEDREALLSLSELTPLTQANKKRLRSFFVTNSAQNAALNQELSQAILQGLATHPQPSELVRPFINWSIFPGSASNPLSFTQLPLFLEKEEVSHWQRLGRQTHHLLDLRSQLVLLILQLQALSFLPTNSLEKLFTALYSNNQSTLEQLFELCVNSQAYDLSKLLSYLIAAKSHNLPLTLLVKRNAELITINPNEWINNSLNHIDTHCAQLFSFNILSQAVHRPGITLSPRLGQITQAIESSPVPILSAALKFFISSYYPILQGKISSAESHAFILALNGLFQASQFTMMHELVYQIPNEILTSLIEHCLIGLRAEDKILQDACRQILSELSQVHSELSHENIVSIRTLLGQQDLSILGTTYLIELAKNLLNKTTDSLEGHSLSGVWIQRLLTSPHFVAASTAKDLQHLVARYRLISLTLKQDEFNQLNAWLSHQLSLINYEPKNIDTNNENRATPEQIARIEIMRKNSLEFRADDSVRALLTELEERCQRLKMEETVVADAALKTLYEHYNNSLSSLPSGLLFKFSDAIVSRITADKGDLSLAENTVVGWLSRYLPHKSFEQCELARKQKQVTIYTAEGEEIGFITESNHVMSLVENGNLIPLLKRPGMQAGMALYDKKRRFLGCLSEIGKLKGENLFQENTSALLVAKVPLEQLKKSPDAIQLLLTDILSEESLEKLYDESETVRHSWLSEQLNQHLIKTNKPFNKSNLAVFIRYQSAEVFFNLLTKIHLAENAYNLFEVILNDKDRAKELFNPIHQTDIFAFFNHHNADQIFAKFLINYCDKPCFNQGLQLFANFSQKIKESDLLVRALTLLADKKNVEIERYDLLLRTLVHSETCAKILWRFFLNGSSLESVQKIDEGLGKRLTSFFYKTHCTAAIGELNQQQDWQNSYSYRLLLLIFYWQNKQLFQQKELRYSQTPWSSNELKEACLFARRHLQQTQMVDEHLIVGKKLVGELVFRSANFGQTTLFYDEQGNFDPLIAGEKLNRSSFHAIAARNYLPPEVRQKAKKMLSKLINWFDNKGQDNQKWLDIFEAHQALIDWKKISDNTWSRTESSTTMPLITAYLINYSGSKNKLKKLIKNCFNHRPFATHGFQQVSELMVKLPERDLSLCLFKTIEELISEQPTQLNKTLLSHMAQFYAKRHLQRNLPSQEAGLQLIKYFGLQKKYALVQRCCQLLQRDRTATVDFRTHLTQIKKAAQVEQSLSLHLNSWYFSLFQFFKRLFNYGLKLAKKSGEIVTFCEKESHCTFIEATPTLIKTTVISGQIIEDETQRANHTIALRKRYDSYLAQRPQIEVTDKKRESAQGSRKMFFSQPICGDTSPVVQEVNTISIAAH